MVGSKEKHDQLNCPASSYCQALEHFGVNLREECACSYDPEKDAFILPSRIVESIEAIGQAEKSEHSEKDQPRETLGENRKMVQALLSAIEESLRLYHHDTADYAIVEKLITSSEALFEKQKTLWEEMIRATRDSRPFTDVELDHYLEEIELAKEQCKVMQEETDPSLVLRAQCAHDRELKKQYALQFDHALLNDIDRLVSNVVNAHPALIVGDKGIAKTQIAKFVMSLYGRDPFIISVKGDMMSDELIGKLKHDKENNTFVFQEGALLTAMREGLPILLDEINFGDQAIIARLQDILLKKPGDTVFVQESGEESLVVAPGFMVFATANEASLRYRHREILDPAIRDRFDIVIRSYPDLENDPLTETPTDLLRLALSSAVDDRGILSKHINLATLEAFTRLAHITQYLYAVPAKDVVIDFAEDRVTSIVLEESQPLMTDCITPRTLSKIIADCAGGNLPGMKLNHTLIRTSIRSLDQAGSTHNFELAEQIRLMMDLSDDLD